MRDALVLLNHLDNITRNQDVLGCSENSTNVIFMLNVINVKHVEHLDRKIMWTGKFPGAEKSKWKNLISLSVKNLMVSFSVHGRTEKKKNAGLWFATCVSAQPDTMPNVTI